MNSPISTIPPVAAIADDETSTRVALGIDLAHRPGIGPQMEEKLALFGAAFHQAGISSYFSIHCIEAGITAALKSKGVLVGSVQAQGDFLDLLIEFRTTNREEAVATLLDFCDASLLGGVFAVAWFDSSEGAWRLVRRGIFIDTFEEFTTPARIHVRCEKSRNSIAQSRAVFEAVQFCLQSGRNTPPDTQT